MLMRGNVYQTENMLIRSSDFSAAAAWIPVNVVTVTANNVVAPDGTLTADKIVIGASAYLIQNSVTSPLLVYTYSLWMRADTPQSVGVWTGDGNDGDPIYQYLASVTTAWQRFAFAFVPAVDTTLGAVLLGVGGTPTFYAWGAQLNRGTGAMVYAPTAASASALRANRRPSRIAMG